MSRKCTICADKNRCAIDQCVVKGEPIRRIASHFDVGEKSLERHVKAGHVSKVIEAVAIENEKERGLDLRKCAQEIYDLALDSAKAAKKANQFGAIGSCLTPAAKVLDILNKGEPQNVNLKVSSDSDLDAKLNSLITRAKDRIN